MPGSIQSINFLKLQVKKILMHGLRKGPCTHVAPEIVG